MALNLTDSQSSNNTSSQGSCNVPTKLKLLDVPTANTFCDAERSEETAKRSTSSLSLSSKKKSKNYIKRFSHFISKRLHRLPETLRHGRRSSKNSRLQTLLTTRTALQPECKSCSADKTAGNKDAKKTGPQSTQLEIDISSSSSCLVTPDTPITPCKGSGTGHADDAFEAPEPQVDEDSPKKLSSPIIRRLFPDISPAPIDPPSEQPKAAPTDPDVLVVDGRRYQLRGVMGAGTYGMVRSAWDIDSGKKVAVKYFKVENDDALNEIAAYKQASRGNKYLPKFLHATRHQGRLVLITDREGCNLGTLATRITHKRFFSQTVAMLGIELMNAFEALHNAGIVHRDVHMGNVMAGHKDEREIFLCDLGFAKAWRNKDGSHVARKELQIAVGTSRFSSINNHKHTRYSRRDDMEEVAYLLINCLAGSLPWADCAKIKDRRKKWDTTMKMKLEFEESEFFRSLPAEIQCYLHEVKKLRFDEKPHYQEYRDMFTALKHREEKKHGVRYFDWMYVWEN